MKQLSPFETYRLFIALKNHFTTKSYDFFKYSGKTNVSQGTFNCRKDRFHFNRLSRRYGADVMQEFIISNLIKNKQWVGDFLEDDAADNFKEYQKRKQAFTYVFSNELDALFKGIDTPSDVFSIKSNQYPIVLNKYLSGEISIEVLSVLNSLIGFDKKFDEKLGSDDVIWNKIKILSIKLHPFLEYDRNKIKTTLKNKLYTIDMDKSSC